MIREFYKRIGINVAANITGDGRVADICRAHGASFGALITEV